MRATTLERAFELAASGRYVTVTEIRNRLSEEGYFTAEVRGPLLCRQLTELMVAARARRAGKIVHVHQQSAAR